MAYNLTPIKTWPAVIALVITLIIWFVIPVPDGVNPNAWHLLAMFVAGFITLKVSVELINTPLIYAFSINNGFFMILLLLVNTY